MSYSTIFVKILELINEEKIKRCDDSTLAIEERNKNASLRLVRVVSAGSQAFIIKFDECGFPGQAAFRAHDSLHRACDAVAFCEFDNDPFILCFELKSSEPARREVSEQFRSAHCFIEYLGIILKNYYGIDEFSSWQRRYFVFYDGLPSPVNQRAFREEINNTSPDNPQFIPTKNNTTMYLRKLLGRPLL